MVDNKAGGLMARRQADQAGRASHGAADASPPSGDHPSRGSFVERIARAMFDCYRGYNAETQEMMWQQARYGLMRQAGRALAAMRDPDPRMVAAALPLIQHPSDAQRAIGKKALALLPPVRIEQHFQGEQAASDLVRDWQTMVDSAIAIEAATAGETGTGSTEGESAGPQDIAQPPSGDPQ